MLIDWPIFISSVICVNIRLSNARFWDGPLQYDYGKEKLEVLNDLNGLRLEEPHQKYQKSHNYKNQKHFSTHKKQYMAHKKKYQTHSKTSWQKHSCSNIVCKRKDFKIPPLVVISFDGFANEYRKRNLTPSLERMGECGAKAKHMYPSYPSKTFPNHYSIATGLYPESTGIVDNYVYDPEVSSQVQDVRKWKGPGYFKGEPIWSAAVRQGKRMYCLFYPGCSYNITGYNPTKDIPFGTRLTYTERIKMMTSWLKESQRTRPDLIMAYFDQPDETGHHKKSDQQVNAELKHVDNTINLMLQTFHDNDLLNCINLVILSDHGMQTLNKNYYVDQMINTQNMVVANGVVGRVYLADSGKSADSIVDQLKCKAPERFRVYDRHRLPKRYHYAKNKRVGDVILEGRPGTTFWAQKSQQWSLTSDHGYDPLEPNMHAIFFARGPCIKPHTSLPPFQNIELYNLFSDLLRLNKDVPTNGTEGFIDQILLGIRAQTPTVGVKSFKEVGECQSKTSHSQSQFQSCSSSCSSSTPPSNFNSCRGRVKPVFHSSDSTACHINYCSASIVKSQDHQFGSPTLIYEQLEGSQVQNVASTTQLNQKCLFVDQKFHNDCSNWTSIMGERRDSQLEWHSLAVGKDFQNLNDLQVLFYSDFAKNAFDWLQTLTKQYAQKYQKIGVLTAAVYDLDMDSLADDQSVFWSHQEKQNELLKPSHLLRLFIRCHDQRWDPSNAGCVHPSATRFLAFALPNAPSEPNCLRRRDYLMTNTIRIRDFELLTNLKLFPNMKNQKTVAQWRIDVTQRLWDW